MRRTTFAAAILAITGLAACDETALSGTGAGPALGAPSGGAAGDSAFSRDERGCLYEEIGGAKVAIVDASGRQKCDTLSL